MTSSAPSHRRIALASPEVDLDRFVPLGLLIVAVVSALFIYHQTRGSSFSPDDLTWIHTRRGDHLGTFLAPYNGHLSLVPIAIYRVMFAVVGIGSFVPYRLLLAVVATLAAIVFFAYARRRVGGFCALLVTTLLLFLGPGWNDIMQPFQIAWLIAMAAGVLALFLLDRRRPAADIAACLALIVSITSTSVGVALLVGAMVDLAVTRRRLRDAWIPGIPLVLYVVWAAYYHSSTISASAIYNAPLDLVQTTGAATAGIIGLSAVSPLDLTGVMLTFGASLLVIAGLTVHVRLRAGWDGSRFLSLAAVLVAFSLLTTVVRSFQSPFESRYMYVTCVLVALMAVELADGIAVSHRLRLGLAALAVVAAVSNLSDLRSGGAEFREFGAVTDGSFTAVDLDRGHVAPGQVLTQLPLAGLGFVFTAGEYFSAERSLGTPALTLAELRLASPAAQQAADAQMLSDGDVRLTGPAPSPQPSGVAPVVTSAAAVTTTAGRDKACLNVLPAGVLSPGQTSTAALLPRTGQISVTAAAQPVSVAVRRFASSFVTIASVRERGSAVISLTRDRAPEPWRLRLQSAGAMRVCGVGVT